MLKNSLETASKKQAHLIADYETKLEVCEHKTERKICVTFEFLVYQWLAH